MLNKKVAVVLVAPVFLLVGCFSPHIFNSTFKAPEIPVWRENGTNVVEGSGFLRQRGGVVVTCAGEAVTLTLSYAKTAYEREWESLSGAVKRLTELDPAYVAFREELRKSKRTIWTTCDVQGRFRFANVPSGNYEIETTVEWYVPSQYGGSTEGGKIKNVLSIPEGSEGQTYSVVVNY